MVLALAAETDPWSALAAAVAVVAGLLAILRAWAVKLPIDPNG